MKKMRKAHLWIGLVASILILMESITGLLMNEPWLIGQSQVEGRGNFQPGQFNQGAAVQGTNPGSSQTAGQPSGQNQTSDQGQASDQTGSNANSGQGGGPNYTGGPGGAGTSQASFMSTIKGLHEGRIGTTNIKWLIDLAAIAMMFLTGSGIYLSMKVLSADKKRKKRKTEQLDVVGSN